MRKWLVLCFSSCLLLLPACGARPQPNGAACSGKLGSEGTCSGGVCLELNQNQQGLSGLCSERCDDDGACREGGGCASIDGLGSFCLATCQQDRDCRDGFVCISEGALRYCGVRVGGGPVTEPGHVDCKASPDCIAVEAPAGYCDRVPKATQVCDCRKAPAASCVAADNGANLWCCP